MNVGAFHRHVAGIQQELDLLSLMRKPIRTKDPIGAHTHSPLILVIPTLSAVVSLYPLPQLDRALWIQLRLCVRVHSQADELSARFFCAFHGPCITVRVRMKTAPIRFQLTAAVWCRVKCCVRCRTHEPPGAHACVSGSCQRSDCNCISDINTCHDRKVHRSKTQPSSRSDTG